MNVLITGGAGAIGQWVVKRLLETGHTVRATDVRAQPKNNDYEYVPADVRDLSTIRQLTLGMEAVIHLAAIPFDMHGQDEQVLDVNLRGTYNVLLAAEEAGARRVVHFSSINALGQAEPNRPGLYLPLDDEVPHYTIRNYALTKHLGEEMCRAFSRRGGLTSVSLRPTLVTHPGPNRFPWFDFMPEHFKVQSGVGDFWSYVDVRDVAEAALLSLTAPIETYQAFLLTYDENRARTPSAELVEKYYAHIPWPKISKVEYLAKGEFISLVDCSAAKRVLGWQPKFSRFDPASGYQT